MVRPLTSREGPTGEGFTFVNNQRTITVNNINHFTQLSADFLQSVSQWLRKTLGATLCLSVVNCQDR
jgi:hypothetical protein